MNLAIAILIVLGVTALAVTAMLLVRRRAPEGSYFQDGDRAAGVFGVLAAGFAIMLGFVIFLAFERYDAARSGSEAEALTVIQQFETAQFLPGSTRDTVGGQLICYGRFVVHREWPDLESGDTSLLNPWGVALFRTIRATDPGASSKRRRSPSTSTRLPTAKRHDATVRTVRTASFHPRCGSSCSSPPA